MIWKPFFCYSLLAILLFAGLPLYPAEEDDAPSPPDKSVEAALENVPDDPPDDVADSPAAKESQAKRFTDLGQAVTHAAKQRSGIFILYTASWCPWCKKELKVFDEPAVAEVLQDWTVAVIDVDAHPKIAKQSGVESLPTVQVQTVDGRIIASQNGFLEADELIDWLKEHQEAILLSSEEFAGEDPPDEETLERLLNQFQNRNPVAREAALHRLLKHREHVAAAVAQRFETGPLQTRLAAWELLHEWQAPVDALDPWQPETLVPEAFATLKTWVQETDLSAQEDEPLSPEQAIELEDEISALLRTEDPAQQRTIREKLARHGAKLLPLIYARLAQADHQADRDRLTVLRYRVVSPTSLTLRWPNGLERLVGENVEERHAAVMELTQQATDAEEGLLLELFSDPDPFVRELCLRALRAIGGSSSNMALLRLLDDPSPDVRAAVLGQLAETPSQEVVPQLIAYVERETDPDLLVHAIRALRAIGNETAIDCLLTLFEHAGWHVRAEAVEAVGAILQADRRNSSKPTLSRQKEIYAAIMNRLKDEDSFVVSRSIGTLRQANLGTSVDPLVDAVLRKPELAGEIVQALAELNSQNRTASVHLRKFAEHEDVRLRAAALSGLLSTNDDQLSDHVQHGLQDPDRSVRIAAAETLFQLLNRELPTGPGWKGYIEDAVSSAGTYSTGEVYVEEVVPDEQPTSLIGSLFKSILGGGQTTRTIRRPAVPPPSYQPGEPVEEEGVTSEEELDPESVPADAEQAILAAKESLGPLGNDAELLAFYRRSDRPEWQTASLPLLLTMLQSEQPEERLAAAQPLVPLGQLEAAWPVLYEAALHNAAAIRELAHILSWLPWDRRREMFAAFLSQPAAKAQFEHIGRQFVNVKDRRTVDYLWQSLSESDVPLAEFPAWHTLMYSLYNLSEYRYNNDKKPSPSMLADWKARSRAGSSLQQLLAACLLYQYDQESSVETARRLLESADAAPPLRSDALEIILLADSPTEARERAITIFRDAQQPLQARRVALAYLTSGRRALSYLYSTHVWIDTSAYYGSGFDLASRHIPGDWGEPPSEITPHDLRPFREAANAPDTAAQAAFLSVWLHGDRLAWRQLLDLWRQQRKPDQSLNRLVYRAIAELDDESQTPILTQIYEQIHEDTSEVREFYWTVRSLTGPDILKLRKRIRDEVGMDQLRH